MLVRCSFMTPGVMLTAQRMLDACDSFTVEHISQLLLRPLRIFCRLSRASSLVTPY